MYLGLLLFFTCYTKMDTKIIKNIDIPSCRNCIHYNPPFYSDFTSSISQCNYFGTKDINTDTISYDYADICRNDENKCGIEGKYFEENTNMELRILLHYIVKNTPFALYMIILTVACIDNVNTK